MTGPNKAITRSAAALIAVLALVSGCSDDDAVFEPPAAPPAPPAPPPPPPPPPGGQAPETQFGAGFLSVFIADPTSAPIDPLDGDIIPIDTTADPLDIPDPQ